MLASGPADDPTLARLRGRLALAQRDGPAAIRYFRRAYEHDPQDRDLLLGLINAFTLAGDDKDAAPLREKARDFERINSLVQRAALPNERGSLGLIRELGAACAAAGRLPEARGWYRLAIARDPLDVESQQALFQIDQKERTRNALPDAGGKRPAG